MCLHHFSMEIALIITIGDNVVIGAGSVVTRDLHDNVIAVGNPCWVLRSITEEDKHKYPVFEGP